MVRNSYSASRRNNFIFGWYLLPALVGAHGSLSCSSPETQGEASTVGTQTVSAPVPNVTNTGTVSNPSPTGKVKPSSSEPTVGANDSIPQALLTALDDASTKTAKNLQSAYPYGETNSLGYDAEAALGLDLIQASPLALNPAELKQLKQSGVVISPRNQFPSFSYGYKSIYSSDLPVYVSADSILEAVHRTFDGLLESTESGVLIPELRSLLTTMRAKAPSVVTDTQVASDVDLYLGLALALLNDALPASSSAQLKSLFEKASAAMGHEGVKLFGVERDEDFSQFTPRGHYADTPELSHYFKSMMWLGRVDLRIVEVQSTGEQLFHRRQFDASAAVALLLRDEAETARFRTIDDTIGAYVGEHDNMTPAEMLKLLNDLGCDSFGKVLKLTDAAILDALVKGGYGAQRIASRIIVKDSADGKTLPLDRSFRLFGQRYTVDSHTFTNTTYDRIADRLKPTGLDAAFAAFGNNSALKPLEEELTHYGELAPALAKTRTLVDAHEDAYWESSLYTRWLGALRELSPGKEATRAGIALTPGWNTRILSTQLASWAQLRHDTILYAKQAYGAGISCEFPDAYVDPYPEFYRKLSGFAQHLIDVTPQLPESAASAALKIRVQSWASLFTTVTDKLAQMADNQLTGTPHSPELIAFINDAVKWKEQPVCGGTIYTEMSGWYFKLYENAMLSVTFDPTVADVYTQPTDSYGADLGRILHVATGTPRLMVITAETCAGPRAYAGLAMSYAEFTRDNWKRLTDQEWALEANQAPFPDPVWMKSLLGQ